MDRDEDGNLSLIETHELESVQLNSDEREYLARYLQYLEVNRGRASGTCDAYLRQLERLGEYLGLAKAFQEASQEDLERFTGIHLHELGVSPRSRRVAIAAVRGFYKWLHSRGITSSNLASRVSYPKTGRRLPTAMSLKNAESLIQTCDLNSFTGVRDAAILLVLVGTGLRVSGLSGLNEGDLVSDADEKDKISAFIRVAEKGGHQRFVPAS